MEPFDYGRKGWIRSDSRWSIELTSEHFGLQNSFYNIWHTYIYIYVHHYICYIGTTSWDKIILREFPLPFPLRESRPTVDVSVDERPLAPWTCLQHALGRWGQSLRYTSDHPCLSISTTYGSAISMQKSSPGSTSRTDGMEVLRVIHIHIYIYD